MSDGPHDDQIADRDVNVGYGRPPVRSRWKPGQSGNPRGRPPKPKTGPKRRRHRRTPKKNIDPNPAPSETPSNFIVGYKRPPVHSRWKPGESGNTRGRRPRDILQEVLLSPFPVKIGGRVEMVPALDAMLLRIRARAIEGDQKAIRCLLELFDSKSLARSLVRQSAK